LPKKIRVYELGRELGLTNKEALDLCLDLGIGVTSHSSSIEDAQGDRVGETAGDDIGAGDRRSHNHKTGPELQRLPRFLGSPNPPFRYEGQTALAKLTQQAEIGAGNAGGIGSIAGGRC